MRDYDDAFKARRKLEESPSRKKSPFSRNTDGNANGFSPRKYHGSPQYTRKFGSHSAIGSANWLHVKFQKPEFAKTRVAVERNAHIRSNYDWRETVVGEGREIISAAFATMSMILGAIRGTASIDRRGAVGISGQC